MVVSAGSGLNACGGGLVTTSVDASPRRQRRRERGCRRRHHSRDARRQRRARGRRGVLAQPRRGVQSGTLRLGLRAQEARPPRWRRAASSIAASLFDFARANLVDGCVAETYSALELVWMGDHAVDDLRGLFARTADDEVAHAGLAFEIHDWLLPQHTLEERERLSTELRDALRRLIEQASIARPSALAELGLPPMTVASALAVELAACLLSIDGRAHRPLS